MTTTDELAALDTELAAEVKTAEARLAGLGGGGQRSLAWIHRCGGVGGVGASTEKAS